MAATGWACGAATRTDPVGSARTAALTRLIWMLTRGRVSGALRGGLISPGWTYELVKDGFMMKSSTRVQTAEPGRGNRRTGPLSSALESQILFDLSELLRPKDGYVVIVGR